jgi:hypothetical protein
MTAQAQRYVITLEGEGGIHILRRVLKRLLRGHSLKCIDVREVNASTTEEGQSLEANK